MLPRCQSSSGQFDGCDLPADETLVAQGWQRRYIADPRRAQDAVEFYDELGFEVRLEPVDTDLLSEACGGCKVLFQNFKAIYTRKKKTGG